MMFLYASACWGGGVKLTTVENYLLYVDDYPTVVIRTSEVLCRKPHSITLLRNGMASLV